MTEEEAPFRLRRAETVLRHRTSRLVLVMERPWNDENVQAVVRTAEAFGLQHVWTIRHPTKKAKSAKSVTKGSHRWLTKRFFDTIEDCIAAMREEGLEIWATDLAPGAIEVAGPESLRPFPERVALVVGRELQGVSEKILEVADRRLFLPMRGFTESFNLSVATALMLQRCFDADPTLVGAMSDEERNELRPYWFDRLAKFKEGKLAAFRRFAQSPPEPLESLRPLER
ncbi:MAG: RNA methyltransferase, partial [Planctomycetota bacterium]